MRRVIEFECDGAALFGTLDEGERSTGLLIVSGGNEIRIGAHRGMAEFSQILAKDGYPSFRFDRRGVGDSEGDNDGFRSSGPDIMAALGAFRSACPGLQRIVAFGNCDAATALLLHTIDVDGLVLANPWIVEPIGDLPPPAAIKSHYVRRLRDPMLWTSLLRGKLDVRAGLNGLRRIAMSRTDRNDLAQIVAARLAASTRPTTIILADRDNTAIAFAAAWKTEVFYRARARDNIRIVELDSASHSFASASDFDFLVAQTKTALG